MADIKGLDNVLKNFKRHIGKIEKRLVKNLLTSGKRIKSESQNNTPVDTSNLKRGAYVVYGGGGEAPKEFSFPTFSAVRRIGEGGTEKRFINIQLLIQNHLAVIQQAKSEATIDPFARIGHSAPYAEVVHFDEEVYHDIGGAFFLQNAALAHQHLILPDLKKGIA